MTGDVGVPCNSVATLGFCSVASGMVGSMAATRTSAAITGVACCVLGSVTAFWAVGSGVSGVLAKRDAKSGCATDTGIGGVASVVEV